MKKLKFCDLCNHKEFEFLFNNHDRMYPIKKEYRIEKCKKCGLIFVNPQPSNVELSEHYPKKFYSYKAKIPKKRKFKLYKILFSKSNIILKILFLPFKYLLGSTKVIENGKFLDVGCGSGEFLMIMNLLKMDSYGVEPGDFNKNFVKEQKLKIFHGTLDKANYQNDFFDVIGLSWVFEHVNNPTEVIKELYRITKPGGTVFISVPQSKALMYKLFKKYWVGLDTPRHLFIYSPKILKEYAKKTGFKVKKIRYPLSNILPTILYLRNKHRKNKIYLSDKNFSRTRFLNILFLPLIFILSFLRAGDTMEAELKKPKN